MSALTTIVVVGALAWGASRLQRMARKAGRAAGRASAPAWPGEGAPPLADRSIEPASAATVPVGAPRVQLTVRRPPDVPVAAPRGFAAIAQAQAAALAGQPPRGHYPLSSQPQRRRIDRSARLFAQAKGPGLCSPRTRP